MAVLEDSKLDERPNPEPSSVEIDEQTRQSVNPALTTRPPLQMVSGSPSASGEVTEWPIVHHWK